MKSAMARFSVIFVFVSVFLFACGGAVSKEGQEDNKGDEQDHFTGGFVGNVSPCWVVGYTYHLPGWVGISFGCPALSPDKNFQLQPAVGDNVYIFFVVLDAHGPDTYFAFRNITGANAFNFSNMSVAANVGWVTLDASTLIASPSTDAVSGASFVEEFTVPDAEVAGIWQVMQSGVNYWNAHPYGVNCSEMASRAPWSDWLGSYKKKYYEATISQNGSAISFSFTDNTNTNIVINGTTNGKIMLLSWFDDSTGEDVKMNFEMASNPSDDAILAQYSIEVSVPGGMCRGEGYLDMTRN